MDDWFLILGLAIWMAAVSRGVSSPDLVAGCAPVGLRRRNGREREVREEYDLSCRSDL